MHRAINVYFILLCVSVLSSCSSYQTVPNSYIVKGEDNFESIQEKFSIYMGPYAGEEMWDGHKSHLTNDPPSRRYVKLFKKLGYDKKSYAVVFSDTYNSKYGMAALINNSGGKNQKLIDLGNFQLKSEDNAKWYAQTIKIGTDSVYHAVIPMYNKGIAEKYLTIIKVLPKGENIKKIEHFVQQNAKTYQDLGYTLSNLKLPTCPQGVEEIYHDYVVPQLIKKNPGYYLLKVYKDEEKDKALFFYTLLGPSPIAQGAFRACPGRYRMLFTTLEGEPLHSEELDLR
ncbi:hypothetical protein HP439_18615 [Sphingobacterium shayense]|uniref:hypothetical protein n=1 Tax=Sphingobacterium shayense TaxID=626343 RepID=UPI0015527CE1|nr:hypothetical protein [Sphingobacterium shayense]NQD72740.1 hypothetical protein [Sphingobacterium shayense]